MFETAKQAKTALDLGAKKIQRLDEALDEERRAHAAAEKTLADLRVEFATLAERAPQADERRALIEPLPPGGSNMTDRLVLAEQVRSACLQAALEAYEQAGIAGLCGEGRWELAVQAIRTLDLTRLLDVGRASPKDSL